MIKTATKSQLILNSDFCFDSVAKIPRSIQKAADRPHAPDVFTPLKHGKEWLFEYTRQFQPRTAQCLLNGEELFICGEMPGAIPQMSLYVEVNGLLLVIGVNSKDASPDNSTFNIRFNNRFLSLPEEISKAYYFRFDGIGIEAFPQPLGNGKFLPCPSSSAWSAVDGFLAQHHLRKQMLPVLREKIPGLDYKTKIPPQTWGSKFMSFLETPPENGICRKFDALFVKNHIQDGVIYLVHDLDVENMMTLHSPAEAIDRYCEHILTRAEGRFDFLQFASKM